jgi:hypothetical protein
MRRYSIAELERAYKNNDKPSRAMVWTAVPQLIKDVRRLRRERNNTHKLARKNMGDSS